MILIADEMHPSLMEGLRIEKIPFDYKPLITPEATLKIIARYEGIVLRSKFNIDGGFFDEASNLKFIARAGSGTDNIDAEYAASKGISIINAPEALSDTVAEHTVGLMLSLVHQIAKSNNEVKLRQWNREANRGGEIMDSTIGIIGYGNTGSAVAKRLSGFGTKVLAYDKYKIPVKANDQSFFFDHHATSCSLNTIYEQSDILTLHIPLTEETAGWADKKFFEQFRKPIIFINCARGAIVNSSDLVEALQNGKVRGAALDVLEKEPPFRENQDDPVWFEILKEMPNTILTPHIAGWSTQSYKRISEVILKKIISLLKQ